MGVFVLLGGLSWVGGFCGGLGSARGVSRGAGEGFEEPRINTNGHELKDYCNHRFHGFARIKAQKRSLPRRTRRTTEFFGELRFAVFSNTFWIKTVYALSMRASTGLTCFAPATLSPCDALGK